MAGEINQSNRGSLSGFVVARNGPAIGKAERITYDVRVDFPADSHGPGYSMTFLGVVPAHRRPSSVLDIEAANVGDEVIPRMRGNAIQFLIFEGLAAGEECV